MKNNSRSEVGAFNPRAFVAFLLCSVGALLAMLSFAAPPSTPTFGHPTISGIGGVGFEQGLRVDPSNANRLYTSAPGSLSSDTSWIWHSLDGGKTFKWVIGATALEGKVTTCFGGGDSETGVDSAGHLYFADLTLANFSTSRSDDQGATFTCSNTGVPDAVVDRQWYAFDGDPTNGGSIYLTNDEFAQAPATCGSVTNFGQNILVMYRSPVAGAGATAGIQFGPANKISNPLGCDEGIMGNNEVSPVATTLGQPNGSGGFVTLPTPVKHIFVVHDDALLNRILVGRCFPVAFGPPVANVSDPSGLNCADLPVANLGSNNKTGGNFPTMAIDKAGNLYAVWEQAPINASGQVIGDTVLKYSYSTDQGNTWAAPIQIDTSGSPVGTLHNNVFAWIVAGDDGRVDIAWYGTPGVAPNPSNGPDSCSTCDWSLWMAQTLNGHATVPKFTAPILASEHFIHRGSMFTLIGGQNGDRTLGDFLQLRMGANGEAEIGYADSNNVDEIFAPHGMFVRQNGGSGLLAASSPVNIPGLTPFNTVSDPSGDGKYEVNGLSSANMPQLDILNSSIAKITTAPCSAAAPCYQVVMQLNNLTLAPTTTQDPDPDLVWLTQWLVPSTTDPNGGKNFFVYAESFNGGALQCFVGENAAQAVGGGVTLTYPGATQLPAANCLSTMGPNGTITIDVPLSDVNEPGAIDSRLHEVTASTMTLLQPANTVPSLFGIGGSLFNLIDVAQGYTFDSAVPPTPTPTPTPNPLPCSGTTVEDDDPHIAYSNGWHLISNPSASAGHFHLNEGGNNVHNAVLTFDDTAPTGSVTYFYATSPKGGSAEVFLDNNDMGPVSYNGPSGSNRSPIFGVSKSFSYGPTMGGHHTLEIRPNHDAVYIDGFCLPSSATPTGTPAAYPGATSESLASQSAGQALLSSITLPTGTQAISIAAEPSVAVPIQLVLINPSGTVVQTVSSSSGVAILEAPITQSGVYIIKTVNLSLGPVQIWSVATPLVSQM